MDPLQLERLAIHRLPGHVCDGPQDAQGRPEPDALDVVEQWLQRHRQHGITHVDGDGDAVVDVQRRLATTPPRLVLDVVMDEKGVVIQLQRRGGRQHRLKVAAEPQAGRDAQRRPECLPAAKGVVEDQLVKSAGTTLAGSEEPIDLAVARRLALCEIVLEHVQGRHSGGPVKS